MRAGGGSGLPSAQYFFPCTEVADHRRRCEVGRVCGETRYSRLAPQKMVFVIGYVTDVVFCLWVPRRGENRGPKSVLLRMCYRRPGRKGSAARSGPASGRTPTLDTAAS